MNAILLGIAHTKSTYIRTESGIYDIQGAYVGSLDFQIDIASFAQVSLFDRYGGGQLVLSLQESAYCMLEIAALRDDFAALCTVSAYAHLDWHGYALRAHLMKIKMQVDCCGEGAMSIGTVITMVAFSYLVDITYGATHRAADTHSFFQAIALVHDGFYHGSGLFDIQNNAYNSVAVQHWQGVCMNGNGEYRVIPSYKAVLGNSTIKHTALCCQCSESFLWYLYSRGFDFASIQKWYAQSILTALLQRIKAAGGREDFVLAIQQKIIKINIS